MEIQAKSSCVVLILEDTRLSVNREPLISKSKYFASLLSESYIDHLQEEHIIHYNILLSTLKDYISWIHDEDICTKFDFVCKRSLERYCNHNSYEDLLRLLHLSVLFSTDSLTAEITVIIEAVLMIPEFLIDIWLIAIDLGLSPLQDILFAACLEYFEKLPLQKLIDLESHNLYKLLNNENIFSSEQYLQNILLEWKSANKEKIELQIEKLALTEAPAVTRHREPKILSGIIDYEKPRDSNSKIFLYCWDGENFFKHSTLTYPEEITNIERASRALIGMQFTGRRYDVYMCGGEYGLGRQNFNQKIWRYSLISKKWSVDTHLPNPRRHTITVFFENNLYLFGGAGSREQSRIVDIYNVHSRTWSRGSNMPTDIFTYSTKIPEYCVVDDKLIIYTLAHIFIYCTKHDTWTEADIFNNRFKIEEPACFIDVMNKGKKNNIVKYRRYDLVTNRYEEMSKRTFSIRCSLTKDCKKFHIMSSPAIKCKNHDNEYIWLCKEKNPSADGDRCNAFHVHTVPIQRSKEFDSLFSSFFSTTRQFFHIMDPANLYSEANVHNCTNVS